MNYTSIIEVDQKLVFFSTKLIIVQIQVCDKIRFHIHILFDQF